MSKEALAAFNGTVEGWEVLYDVSEGMDTHTTCSTQQWNPFNGDVVAPDTWFRFGFTRGILCAYGRDDNNTVHACIFVFEYVLEHGLLLKTVAEELQASGLPVQGIVIDTCEPNGVSFSGVNCGTRPCFTAIRFCRPAPVPVSGLCCELHSVLKRAQEGENSGPSALALGPTATAALEAFQALSRSRDATSGHMKVKKLLTTSTDGRWSTFVQEWMQGVYLPFVFPFSDTNAREACCKSSLKRGRRAFRAPSLFTEEDFFYK